MRYALFALIIFSLSMVLAEDAVLRVGAGSLGKAAPPQAQSPQEAIYATENVRGKMPTNDWWSSAAWMKFSERQYPHPLAVQAESAGLRVYYPGTTITANRDAIFGFMPADTGNDLVLGHSEQATFEDARVDDFSDWFVTLRLGRPGKSLRASYGHGSPFVYATLEGGSPTITFAGIPKRWHGDENSAVLGCTIGGKHYALFGPSGSTWEGLDTQRWVNRSSKAYFALALLPDDKPSTLALFRQYAYAHVVDTQVSWRYDPASSQVVSDFAFVTKAYEGGETGTLFAIYPHQWRNTDQSLTDLAYSSVRGTMKVGAGQSFRTTMRFPGVLPCLPKAASVEPNTIAELLKSDERDLNPPLRDTYWDGKWLGKLTTLAAIADTYGLEHEADALRAALGNRLESWFTAVDRTGQRKNAGLFVYNERWGTLIGYPASYGSDVEMNDHHFHYGYFIKAAAEIAQHDPAWAAEERFGGLVRQLIRDIANPRRDDERFPFLRNFDPYAGHSWASGHARFGDGNNNESSSEAMNAWCGILLWGEATGDIALRDLGLYLYTTEMNAIQEYWFDIRNENHPPEFTPSVVTMIWGGKGANATWFSANPEVVHGINWLPIHGGSLYLGHHREYAEKNYQALVEENKGAHWDEWRDLVWMYRALSDPDDAWKQYHADAGKTEPEAGNSHANTLHWIATLRELGQIDPSVTANHPLAAVFSTGKGRTYVAYNLSPQTREVRFSDGHSLSARPQGFSVSSSNGVATGP
jgi:endoglucanase Acf2